MKTLTDITEVEKSFYEMSKMDRSLQEYFFTYYSQKLILYNHIYPRVPEVLKGFNDHGYNHITRILNLYSKFLRNNILDPSSERDFISNTTLNYYELYLLLCATLWHDVGNSLGRSEHEKRIIDVMDRLKNHFFVDEDLREYALQIAEAHTGNNAITTCIPHEDTDYNGHEINLRFLGATLRLVDELEEGELRIDKTFFNSMSDLLDDRQKIFWMISKCIKRINPDPDRCIIEINARIKNSDIFTLFKKEKKGSKELEDIALIDELIFRIDKINKERINYMKYVRKHVNYNRVRLNLTVVGRADLGQINFTFDDDHGYNTFWKTHTDLSPEDKIESYELIYR